jgi:putative sterol carrier protein
MISSANDIFENIKTHLTPEKAKKINASFYFDIGGDQGGKWTVDLTKEKDWVTKGESDAQCKISIANPDDWVAIANGKMNPTMAFMQGKVKVKGDMSLALKLQSLLA